MKRLSILGSTGSIGTSTLDLVRAHPDRYSVVSLTAGRNIPLLLKQIEEFSPKLVSVQNSELANKLFSSLGTKKPEIVYGVEGLIQAATMPEADMVLAAIVGAAGLAPTYSAILAGKDIALANKETLVTAGHLIMGKVKEKKTALLPVDSEHSAIFQSMQGHRKEDITKIILTASGGPFLNLPISKLSSVTIDQALNHPNWSMGRKITVDSATMMNKGLEVIEAKWLFDIAPEKIDVLIHPQSIVHSMVEYLDGCIISEMGVPDMKAPIAFALSYPERISTGVPFLDLAESGALTFSKPEKERFPSLFLAYQAMNEGESMPAVMNAANEAAVAAFLDGRIGFTGIYELILKVMDAHSPHNLSTVEEVLSLDRWSRKKAEELLSSI